MSLVNSQLTLFDTGDRPGSRTDVSSTFQDNARLPVHRWFRFSAGISATWAANLIKATGAERVLDPIAGSGTTILAAEEACAAAIGVEAHPFLFRIGSAKLLRRTPVDQ